MKELTYADGYWQGIKHEQERIKKYFGLKTINYSEPLGKPDLSHITITDDDGVPLKLYEHRYNTIIDDYTTHKDDYPNKELYYKYTAQKFNLSVHTIKNAVIKYNNETRKRVQ